MKVFEAVKHIVTARQPAEHYGIKVTRKGMSVRGFCGIHVVICTG